MSLLILPGLRPGRAVLPRNRAEAGFELGESARRELLILGAQVGPEARQFGGSGVAGQAEDVCWRQVELSCFEVSAPYGSSVVRPSSAHPSALQGLSYRLRVAPEAVT
jgi:hypothetical protein